MQNDSFQKTDLVISSAKWRSFCPGRDELKIWQPNICLLQLDSHLSRCHKWIAGNTVYPKKCAHGFAVLCFVVVMQSFKMNSHGVFIQIHQGCFAGIGAIVRLPQCQWSKPDGYGQISQCITTTKHSKAKTMCIFLGIYCTSGAGESWEFHVLPVKKRISLPT